MKRKNKTEPAIATMENIEAVDTNNSQVIPENDTEKAIATSEEVSTEVKQGDIVASVIEGIRDGITIDDFKTRLALTGFMKDTDDLQIGRLGKTGCFHLAIINQKESTSSFQVMIGGKLVPMLKGDFDNYFMSGVYIGADLILYMNADTLIHLKGTIIINQDGTIVKL